MLDFKEKLLPIFKGNEEQVDAYLNYITSHTVVNTEEYTESHHILPESLFPEYKKCFWNKVNLLAYDHYVVHYLLAFQRNKQMLHALNNMNRLKKINVRKNLEIISEQELDLMSIMYEEFRKDIAKNNSELNKGRIHSEESRKNMGLSRQGKVNVVHREQGEPLFIQSEEYKNNKHIYRFIAEGRTQSEETKRKMSDNGIKGQHAYTNITSGEIIFSDIEPGADWVLGNLRQSDIAIERFTNSCHWTNTVTGESMRAKKCPGENWIKKRQNFSNVYAGKTSCIDLITGESTLIETEKKLIHQVVHNKILYIFNNTIFVNIEDIALFMDLPKQFVFNGIKTASVSPETPIQKNNLVTLSQNEKYQYLIKKTFGDVFGVIQRVPAKSIAGKLKELKLSIHAGQAPS